MIPTTGRRRHGPGRPRHGPGRLRRPSEAVRLEERPDRLGDLLVALLTNHEAVVGVGPERFVVGAKPFRKTLRGLLRDRKVEPRSDDQLGHAGQRPAIDGYALEDLPAGGVPGGARR